MIIKSVEYQLLAAARNGNLDAVRSALLAGADVHASDDYALQFAANYGHAYVVDLLLKSGADVHADYELALRWSVNNNHLHVVDLLLRSGSELTALHEANLSKKQLINLLKQYAATAHRGFEAVMMLDETTRRTVMRHLHPELKPKQIREQLAMFEAMGLDAAQMAEMWQAQHGTVSRQQEFGVAL